MTRVDQAGFPSALVFDLERSSPFSFKCQVCSACCHNKAIRVAPYEALRLSRNLGITTTEFYGAYTEEGGLILRNNPDGSCVFLESHGCGVHRDRPLVCRLFPLGEIVDKQGKEKFGNMPLHPDCLGLLGTDGTVAAYLESQVTGPYFHYDALYSAAYKKMEKKLQQAGRRTRKKEARSAGHTAPAPAGSLLSSWLDIDTTVDAICRKEKIRKPAGQEELVKLHLVAIEEWLAVL